VALLVLLAGTTGARIVTTHLFTHAARNVGWRSGTLCFSRLVPVTTGIRVLVLHIVQMRSSFLLQLLLRLLHLLRRLNSHRQQDFGHLVAHSVQQGTKQLKGFALVFLLGVFLGITAQVNALAQVIQCSQVFTPVRINALQKQCFSNLAKESTPTN